ncbi:hypothetical protein M9H77_16674 [Catharanthus roseus]|uniref:Uncharacterized protein n=1 Tax=Catharanthus roseus TaxID=4058 RepID=A0ACC0B2F7_CATRO|nr:hypothetical protein M9H77_16674 [Catharanthus roseus]
MLNSHPILSEQQCSQGEYELFHGNEIKADEEPFEVRKIESQPKQVDGPKVGSFYNNIDDLFDSYLMYANSRGFSIDKKFGSKGNGGSFRKYETIACDRGRKSTGTWPWPNSLRAANESSRRNSEFWSSCFKCTGASQNGSRSQSHRINVPTTVQREEEIHEETMWVDLYLGSEYPQSIVQSVEMKLQHHLTI